MELAGRVGAMKQASSWCVRQSTEPPRQTVLPLVPIIARIGSVRRKPPVRMDRLGISESDAALPRRHRDVPS